jgi:hypothetical protein
MAYSDGRHRCIKFGLLHVFTELGESIENAILFSAKGASPGSKSGSQKIGSRTFAICCFALVTNE